MLILQIVIGIVLAVLVLNFLGDILVLSVGAIILIAVVLLIAVVGIFLYEAITLTLVLALSAVCIVIYILYRFFQSNWYLKKELSKQIKKREDLGYVALDLREKLKKMEADEFEANVLAKELSEKNLVKSEDYKSLVKSLGKDKAKEIARRRSLGYKE